MQERDRQNIPLKVNPRAYALHKVHGVPMKSDWMQMYPPHLYSERMALEDIQAHQRTGRGVHTVPQFHTVLRDRWGSASPKDARRHALKKIHGLRSHEISNVLRQGSYTQTQALENISRHMSGKAPRHSMSRGIKFTDIKTGAKSKEGRPGYTWGYTPGFMSDRMYSPPNRPHPKHHQSAGHTPYVTGYPVESPSEPMHPTAPKLHFAQGIPLPTSVGTGGTSHHHTGGTSTSHHETTVTNRGMSGRAYPTFNKKFARMNLGRSRSSSRTTPSSSSRTPSSSSRNMVMYTGATQQQKRGANGTKAHNGRRGSSTNLIVSPTTMTNEHIAREAYEDPNLYRYMQSRITQSR